MPPTVRALTYDNNWNLLADRNLAGQQVAEYIHGSRTDEILRAQLDGKLFYPLADGLGSTVAVANAAGNVVDRIRYDVYGTPRFLSATYKAKSSINSGHRFLFTGREWLGQFGLSDHRNRYYSPSLGRFINTDPVKFKGGVNLYSYCGNAATMNADLFGLCCLAERRAWLDAESAYDDAVRKSGVATADLNALLSNVNNDLILVGGSATVVIAGAITTLVGEGTVNPTAVAVGLNLVAGGVGGVILGTIGSWWHSFGLEDAGANLKQARADAASAWDAYVAAGEAYIACDNASHKM